MPSIPNHPVRLLRARAGMTQGELAKEAGVTRPAIAAIEEGRVKKPGQPIIHALSVRTGVTPEVIERELEQWRTASPTLSRRATNTLALPPEILRQYSSFAQWREDIAPTITAFASLAKTPRASVARYEKGELAQMPSSLINALYSLGASDVYISELMNVPNGYDRADD